MSFVERGLPANAYFEAGRDRVRPVHRRLEYRSRRAGRRQSSCTDAAAIRFPQMKRSSDRFIDGASDGEQDASVEVYLIVTDESRRTVSTGLRYLVFALAIAATGAALSLTSLGSGWRGRSAARPLTAAAARSVSLTSSASRSASLCIRAGGYGGLGARLSDFDANNNNSTGPGEPSPGPAFYTVTATARGCVTAFAVQEFTTPPPTAPDLLFLVSHPYLPGDAKQILTTYGCAVWKSIALKRVTGRAYAQATASGQVGSLPGRAQIEATSNPTC